MKIYRLLRDNKETGPFSLEELVSRGLKLYDLVWVDGKSAAWRYPSEVAELSIFAPGSEDQPFDAFFRPKSDLSSAVNPQVQEGKVIEPAQGKEKPRFRVTATSNKIDAPGKRPLLPEAQRPFPASENPNHYDYLPRLTSTQTRQVYERNQELPAPALEIKYKRSLDDIKQEYTATVLAGNKNKKSYRYAWLAAASVFVAGVVLGISFTGRTPVKNISAIQPVFRKHTPLTHVTNVLTTPETPGKVDDLRPDVVEAEPAQRSPDQSDRIQHDVPATSKPRVDEPVKKSAVPAPPKHDQVPVQEKPERKKAENQGHTKLEGKRPASATKPVQDKASPEVVMQKAEKTPIKKSSLPDVLLEATSTNQSGRTARINTSRVREQEQRQTPAENPTPYERTAMATMPPPVRTQKPAKKSMDDFVIVEGNYNRPAGGIKDITLNVQNVTSYPLDMIVVDLEYYDRNGRLLKGETLYVHDLPARQNVTVNAPDGNATAKLGYKVSMVSSQRAGVHLIAD